MVPETSVVAKPGICWRLVVASGLPVYPIDKQPRRFGGVSRLGGCGGSGEPLMFLGDELLIGWIGRDRWKRRLVDEETPHQLGILYGETKGDNSPIGVANDANGPEVQPSNERCQVGNVGCLRELRAVVRPRGGAEVSQVDRNEAVALGDVFSLGLPGSVIRHSPMYEDYRCPSSLFDIVHAGPAHRSLELHSARGEAYARLKIV